jgi:hypothetical protein
MSDLSLFENAVKVGLQVTREVFGIPITYTRGSTTLTISNALQGYTSKQSIEVGQAEQVVEVQNWYIAVSDLAGLAPPRRGDLITRYIGKTPHIFSVETTDLGETEWDWVDTGKTQYTIKTRRDGAGAYEVSEPTGFDLAGDEILPG